MSRILAFGDVHVGAGLDYGRTPADRLADQEQTVPADRRPGARARRRRGRPRRRPLAPPAADARRAARRRAAAARTARGVGCDIVAICGNHDVESADTPIALELLEDVVDVYRQPAIAETRAGALALLPWTPVSRLVAQRGGGDRDDTHALAGELLIESARDLRAQRDGRLVLVPHWSIEGASTPTGILTDEFREPVIPLAELVALGFDAVLAAHIHRQQVLNQDPLVAYVGSPAPVDFSEGSVAHGCLLLDDIASMFVPIESRPFVTLDYDLR
jgi:DNA repair exonuclease SbcCD nuclease subunit